ncbi:MAG: YcxB family protein [Rhodoblastus sp.]|nr:MAG: YcxB family protein [Rhodoblastus sp.]
MNQAAEPISFDVRYDDATLRAAAWAFIASAAFGRRGVAMIVALALCLGVLWAIVSRGEWTFSDGFSSRGSSSIPRLWRWGVLHLANMRATVARMEAKRARVRLGEDDIEIVADSGAARFTWRSIASRVERGGVMLLLLSRNQFVTLPLRDTPSSAQDFLRGKIPKLAG